MPKGSKVEKLYTKLKGLGYGKAESAKISQAKTGMSLMSGKKSKAGKGKKVMKKGRR
jgi:hypothetical protein